MIAPITTTRPMSKNGAASSQRNHRGSRIVLRTKQNPATLKDSGTLNLVPHAHAKKFWGRETTNSMPADK